MRTIMTNPMISIPARLRFIKCYVWSTLLYGVETWTISKLSQQRLEAFKIRTMRRMLRINWTRRITNEEVIRIAGTKSSLFETIKMRKLSLLGMLCDMTPCKEIQWREWSRASAEEGGQECNGVTTSPNGRALPSRRPSVLLKTERVPGSWPATSIGTYNSFLTI